ncbi:MAG: hypothetical protein JWP66_1158 [Naasia sp.]|nr:hypothetical protein [Naasia sp.]
MTAPKDTPRRRRTRLPPELQAQIDQARHDLESQVRSARVSFDEAQERINARTGRNLLGAILFGVLLGGSMLASLLFVKELFVLVAVILMGFATVELAGALRHAGRDVPRVASVVAVVAVLAVAYALPGLGHWLAILGAVLFVALWRLAELTLRRGSTAPREVALDLGAGTFVQLYVTVLGSFAVALTALDGGQWWTLAFLLVVIAVDVGAYASGLTFGRHQMAPRISPKKTWEGLAGSVLAALIAGVLLAVFMLDQPWQFGLLFGLVLVATATLGDLAESLVKRDLGIKDISSWLPGHGGFLDRLDSILPSAAAAYALALLFR